MAAVAGRLSRQTLLKAKPVTKTCQANFSFKTAVKENKKALAVIGSAALGGLGVIGYALGAPVHAEGLLLKTPHHHWNHHRFWESLDYKSVRRGYEVYKQVCSACHSLNYLSYREMVGVIFSEEEAKAEAKEAVILDGPNDDGEMFERPGKLTDTFPPPYKNAEAAMAANNGAAPPDLTYIVKGRDGEEDYIFSLLTGYCDPPAGVEVMEDLHFNPYFTGGVIAMAPPLYNNIIEYSDGTVATRSQLAKDVTTFLTWTGEPEFDDRKKTALQVLGMLTTLVFLSYYAKRHAFSVVKAKKVTFKK